MTILLIAGAALALIALVALVVLLSGPDNSSYRVPPIEYVRQGGPVPPWPLSQDEEAELVKLTIRSIEEQQQ